MGEPMGEKEDTVRLVVRLPASLHLALQERAREHRRSLNSEIVFGLNAGLNIDQARQKLEMLQDGMVNTGTAQLTRILADAIEQARAMNNNNPFSPLAEALQKLANEEEQMLCVPPAERIMADGIPQGAPAVAYRRCLHYDLEAGEHRSREDLRCPALVPVQGGGEASYYCSEHQGDAPGAPATIEELEEVLAVLQTKPLHAPYSRLLNTVLEAQSLRVGAEDGKKQ